MSTASGLSRRALIRRAGASGLVASVALPAIAAAAQSAATPAASPVAATSAIPIPPDIIAIMNGPRYGVAKWGLYVADRDSGEMLYALNAEEWFLAASTTKLWSTAAALDAYGADFRFETPIYRTSDVGADGTLTGNLVLVASGDLTMGGRTKPDGSIDFTAIDHINAEALPLATLTPENPVAGLNDLAQQVAKSGIKHVSGDVIIDDRLFPAIHKDSYILTPIWINDNLLDFTVTPGKVGEAATFVWRPETAAYTVTSEVQTVEADKPLTVIVTSSSPGKLLLSGNIPVSQKQLVKTWQVEDPSAFARTLLIEALARQGVTVDAKATGPNPAAKLPAKDSYQKADRVALLTSPPFSENIKLILKVSMNQDADMMIFMLALKHGGTTFDAGMAQIPPFLQKIGLDSDAVSLSDGRGNEFTDLFSPRTVSSLLHTMTMQPDFDAYFHGLPILGVDGTETDTVPASSPVAGKAYAKSGTTVAGDVANQRPLVMTRALAGYVTAATGRELIFASYVNNVPIADLVNGVFDVIHDQGKIVELVHTHN
jgi:D-alanyl-D-alanine carboxypeptidase/D-alanyl-D-alanine-endopeptidase (penicillin-binding protein 4)